MGNVLSAYPRYDTVALSLAALLIHAIGPDPANPKPFLAGMTRIYRGLGVSAVRSITTHGLLWTFFDLVSNYIDRLPE